MEATLQTFAPDGTFISGRREIRGHDAVREWYTGTMRKWVLSHHIPHSHVITFESGTQASGIVTGNEECGGVDTFRVGAYRWYDYVAALRCDGTRLAETYAKAAAGPIAAGSRHVNSSFRTASVHDSHVQPMGSGAEAR